MSISEIETIRRAMSLLGKRNAGVPKTLTAEERAARSARILKQIDAGKMRRGPGKAKARSKGGRSLTLAQRQESAAERPKKL